MRTKTADAMRTLRLLLTALGAAAGLSVFGLALGGCNTVEGAGQDIEAAGEGIEDAADDAQD